MLVTFESSHISLEVDCNVDDVAEEDDVAMLMVPKKHQRLPIIHLIRAKTASSAIDSYLKKGLIEWLLWSARETFMTENMCCDSPASHRECN